MKIAKALRRKPHVTRTRWELDLFEADEADLQGQTPTPQTHSDLFYPVREPAFPSVRPKAKQLRHASHDKLSRTQLRKRLSCAGLRGFELRRTVLDILLGPRLSVNRTGRTVLGWAEEPLRLRLGRRAYRAVTRGVTRHFTVLDEFGSYMAPGIADLFRLCRSVNAKPIAVSQTLGDFEAREDSPDISMLGLLANLQVAHVTLPALPQLPTRTQSDDGDAADD